MQTFDQHLLKHLRAGRITFDEAMRTATSPHDFKLMVAAEGTLADRPAPEPEPKMTAGFSAPAPSAPPASEQSAPPPPAPSAPPPGVSH
jgi:twitching motility protein PilT